MQHSKATKQMANALIRSTMQRSCSVTGCVNRQHAAGMAGFSVRQDVDVVADVAGTNSKVACIANKSYWYRQCQANSQSSVCLDSMSKPYKDIVYHLYKYITCGDNVKL